MRGWTNITFIQPRQVISNEAEGRAGYQLARLNKSDNRSSPNLLNVLSANYSKNPTILIKKSDNTKSAMATPQKKYVHLKITP